jgi:acyl-CoA synthetase (AMP-forming)/AMP-acid ligase II
LTKSYLNPLLEIKSFYFRWRGENVSTIEVESVLSNVLQQQDTIVYGVQVPGVEGRAGMAAIVQPEGGIDLNWFLSAIKNQLPSYAMPIFLRMVKELDITGMNNYIIIFIKMRFIELSKIYTER